MSDCRCGHTVTLHHHQDPGWCRVCDHCQFTPKPTMAQQWAALWALYYALHGSDVEWLKAAPDSVLHACSDVQAVIR